MIQIMNAVLWTTIEVGFVGACLAFYGRYKTLPAFLTGPNICKLEAGGCQVLFRTKNAALLGVPNSALAVLYYPFLAIGLTLHWFPVLLLGAASAAFLMTLVLAYILLRDHLECRVCWTGHICNSLIWLILLTRFVGK